MIVFKKIRWKNLLSTGNTWTEIDLYKDPMTLMVGENGAGKSTILDALCFGLFGKPFRNIRKPQLVNSITRKGMIVEIEYELNKKQYMVRRGMRPNIFEVYKNDKLLNQSAESRDYQEVLEKQILKINYKSFCQVIILGSATFVPFMSLTTGARREIVEDLLDLQIFSVMNVLIKEKINRNLEDIQSNANEKRLTEEKIKLITQHIEEMQTSNQDLLREKNERIQGAYNSLTDAEDRLADLQSQKTSLDDQVKNKGKLQKRYAEFSNYKNKITIKCDHLTEERIFFETSEVCPTCTQAIGERFKRKVIKEHSAKIAEYSSALDELKIKRAKVEDDINHLIALDNQRHDLSLSIMQIETEITNWKQHISDLEIEVSTISERASAIDTGRLIELEDQLEKISKEYNKLYDNRKTMLAAASMLKDGGIKSKIIKQYIPIINKLINKNLAALDFMCHFELDENFNETILSRNRDDFSYASFSEGEKFRINIAILFAWRALARLRNSISTNILVLDEILDGSLDQNGTDEFMKVLSGLTDNNNVFIISHRQDQLIDKFPNTIQFEKIHGFSKVREVI